MEAFRPWLNQGDVFESVPGFRSQLADDGNVRYTEWGGTAVLLTEGCQIDKRTRRNVSKALYFQFSPVRTMASVATIDPNIQGLLRRGDIAPCDIVYLDDVEGEECVALLGEAFSFPARYFDLEMTDFAADPLADQADPWHAVPTRNDNRICTWTAEQRRQAQLKMHVYWTYERPPLEGLVPAEPDEV